MSASEAARVGPTSYLTFQTTNFTEVVSYSLPLSPRPSTDAMVTTPIKPQQLSAGDPSDNHDNDSKGEWGYPQIATPAVVGGMLMLVFVAYIIWQRRPHTKRQYNYRQARSDWTSKLERMFGHRRTRQRVLHSSASVTLDDSMRTTSFMFDFNRRSRQTRSDSTDSETPLTAANFAFDYPPNNPLESPPPIPKRPVVRWWWLLGSRPKQVKSEEPTQRWRVDDGDGSSSSGHEHSSHGHRYARVLMSLYEDPEEGEDEANRTGGNSANVVSTSVTRQLREQVGIMPTIPEHPRSSRTPTPPRAASAPQSIAGTPVSSDRGLPPSYDVSQSQSHYPSTENGGRHLYSGPYIPPPERAAGYSSPRMFHGRDLSSDSFLVTQPPMVATSTY